MNIINLLKATVCNNIYSQRALDPYKAISLGGDFNKAYCDIIHWTITFLYFFICNGHIHPYQDQACFLKLTSQRFSALFSFFISRRIPPVADLLVERHFISSSVNLTLCLAQARTSAYDASLLFLVIITAEALRSFLFLAAFFFTTFTLFSAVTSFFSLFDVLFAFRATIAVQTSELNVAAVFLMMLSLSFMTFESSPPMTRLPFLTFFLLDPSFFVLPTIPPRRSLKILSVFFAHYPTDNLALFWVSYLYSFLQMDL